MHEVNLDGAGPDDVELASIGNSNRHINRQSESTTIKATTTATRIRWTVRTQVVLRSLTMVLAIISLAFLIYCGASFGEHFIVGYVTVGFCPPFPPWENCDWMLMA